MSVTGNIPKRGPRGPEGLCAALIIASFIFAGLGAPGLRAEAEHAAESILAGGAVISSESLEAYPARNVLRSDQAAWVSSDAGAAALDRAFVGFDFQNSPVEATGADIVWVTRDTTPSQVRVEWSDDGQKWIQVYEESAAAPPQGVTTYWKQNINWTSSGAHRFWRLRPAKNIPQYFGVEFLQFRGAAPGTIGGSKTDK